MGQRANLVIVNPDGYELFYSHWCAKTIERDLFWGPEHAEKFIRLQEAISNEGWLDTVWAEGGAVLDLQRKTFLIYGGEDVLYDVPLRRFYLDLLQAAWEGWNIRWAYEGILDIAEYVDVPRAKVMGEEVDSNDARVPSLTPPKQRDWVDSVASFQFSDGLKIFPLTGGPDHYIRCGVDLLKQCDIEESYPEFDVSGWTNDSLQGGVHFDVTRKTIDYWIANACESLCEVAQKHWPGWAIVWHKDRYEFQAEMTNGALRFNEPSRGVLMKELFALLDCDPKPVDISRIAGLIAEKSGDQKVEINPFALKDDRLPVDKATRNAILHKAISKIDISDEK